MKNKNLSDSKLIVYALLFSAVVCLLFAWGFELGKTTALNTNAKITVASE
ncbi:hypothetical protein [Pseudoalteromonas phenolica]|nr:hypothetical protein [Pseudoalteromonas phenolica]MBE0357443.1 hypothetical protein [Pseudoalteromonas phenolica O-BC30]